MRKTIFLLVSGVALLAACQKEVTSEELAMRAAETGYCDLLAGRCDAFVNDWADVDSMPESYRAQLTEAYQMYATQQMAEHQGVDCVRAMRAEYDSTQNAMLVFLQLAYNDSTKEQVVVPMVDRAGTWKFRY